MRSFYHSPFSAVSLTHKNCGLIFCFAKPLTGKCSAKILRLKFAKLRLNCCILSQNCDWNFSLISSPVNAVFTEGFNPSIRIQNKFDFTKKFAVVSSFLKTVTCESIGVADKNFVPDSRMTASSIYSGNWRPYYGRFDETRGVGRWCPQTKTKRNDYLQVDMESVRFVCSVATQGTYSPYYSTSYKLRFSIDSVNWQIYKTDNKAKVSDQKVNELDLVNASFMQPLVVLW